MGPSQAVDQPDLFTPATKKSWHPLIPQDEQTELTGWARERYEQGAQFSGTGLNLTAADNAIPYDLQQNTAAEGLATDCG
jgi:hypothetical protein